MDYVESQRVREIGVLNLIKFLNFHLRWADGGIVRTLTHWQTRRPFECWLQKYSDPPIDFSNKIISIFILQLDEKWVFSILNIRPGEESEEGVR